MNRTGHRAATGPGAEDGRVPLPARLSRLPAGVPTWLLPAVWVLLGALVVAYVLALIALAVVAGLVAVGRMLVAPVLPGGARRASPRPAGTGRRDSSPA